MHIPNGILFDLDGTLYLPKPLKRLMAQLLVQRHLLSPRVGLRTYQGITAYRRAHEIIRTESIFEPDPIAERQLLVASELSGIQVEELRPQIRYWMEEAPLPHLKRYRMRGIIDFLTEAKRRRIRLGVVSDYPAEEKLQALGLYSFFDVVVSAQNPEVNMFKPNSASLLYALGALDLFVDEAIFIGDRADVDVKAAQNCGMKGLLIGKQASPDHFCDYEHLHTSLFTKTGRMSSQIGGLTTA